MDNSEKKENKIIEVSSFSKELLLIGFGTLIGILADQIFFRSNKDYEMKAELRKELLKDQFELLNRILLFSHSYSVTIARFETQPFQLRNYVEQGTNKVIKTDTIFHTPKGPTTLTVPTFIIDSLKRSAFVEDLTFIKGNKAKIDHQIYSKFEELLEILDDHPLPSSTEFTDINQSSWIKPEVQTSWYNKMNELYILTYSKFY